MVDVSAEQTWNRRSGQELDLLASVISASQAWLAFVADNIGFDSHSVSDCEGFDRGMDC